MAIVVRVQAGDFDVGAELAALRIGKPAVGAIANFIGIVRDVNDDAHVGTLALEHYPGMTERAIEAICEQAAARWSLFDVTVIHRYGTLAPTDQIVLVATSSAHRGDALEACGFIMDFLKTQAPFWKKESTSDGERWVDARAGDDEALARWTLDEANDDARGAPPGGRDR
ncbi:MAG: molybdenum cofactor biosynthesis protein MoaE [Burkholderiaceae bacterium]